MYAAFKNVSICSLLKTKIKYILIICLLAFRFYAIIIFLFNYRKY